MKPRHFIGLLIAGTTLAVEAPAPFRIRVVDTYFETDFDWENASQTREPGHRTTSTDRQVLQPLLGVGVAGSVYHPNLVSYHFNTELGLTWQQLSQRPGRDASSNSLLQRYHGLLEFVKAQPYATTIFADKEEIYRDYDFYSRVRVNSERFGLRTGYSTGPVPVSLSATHYEEREVESGRPSHTVEDTLAFAAHNARRTGNTDLNYTYNDFTRTDDGFRPQLGLRQTINALDVENFGRQDWIQLHSQANYSSLTRSLAPNDTLLIAENLQLQHSPRLNTYYTYDFNNTGTGNSTSRSHQLRAGLGHQLYDNLSSGLELHGNTGDSTGPAGSALSSWQYGVSLNEQYFRHLGTWGLLTVGYSGRFDRDERQAAGQFINIVNESHRLTDGIIVYLNQPLIDITSIQVTDPTETIPYRQYEDYDIIQRGPLIEIRRAAGLLCRIPPGGQVLVSYTYTLQPSANYTTIGNAGNFRLDLWNRQLGFYGRWNTTDYRGASQLILRNLDTKVLGLDATWRWFHANAEYEISDSNLSPYDSLRLVETVQWQPTMWSLLTLNLDESWTTYRDTHQHSTFYNAVARGQFRLPYNLSWTITAGTHLERAPSTRQDLQSIGTGFDWAVGKLTLKLDYQYSTESRKTETSARHVLSFRARRSF